MKTSLKALQISLDWQEYVLRNSKDQKQIQRVKNAIEKLKQQINEFKN